MEITEQIAVFLDANNVGIYDPEGLTGDIFIQSLPDQPDEAMAIYSSGGPEADPRGEYGRLIFQILIRSIPNDPRMAEAKTQKIIDLLSGFNADHLTLGGNYIINTIGVQSGPAGIGPDPKHRFEFSQNFIIEYVK